MATKDREIGLIHQLLAKPKPVEGPLIAAAKVRQPPQVSICSELFESIISEYMDLAERAQRHAALGDERRLLIVDQLSVGDRTAAELAGLVAMSGNLLAHHLDVLENAGLIERHVSEGDHRRRYVSLRREELPLPVEPPLLSGRVAFVCTHNSARSQFAAALWRQETGFAASSAGTYPAKQVNRLAVKVAAEFGVDISRNTPSGYESLPADLEVIISVCDRANEAIVPDVRKRVHWSIPDPIPLGTLKAFRTAFGDIAGRIRHVVGEELA